MAFNMSIFILLIFASSLFLYHFIIYPLYLHPLSKIPGPKLASLTNFWIYYQSWNEKRNSITHKLHEKYGPIIRIGPNEISINDVDYIKKIYVTGNFDKSWFYGNFGNYGCKNGFSILDKKNHQLRRKILSKPYSNSVVASKEVESMVVEKISKVGEFIYNQSILKNSKQIDVFELFSAMALDIITAFELGKKNGSNTIENLNSRWILHDYRKQFSMWFWTIYFPKFWNLAASNDIKKSSKRARKWLLDLVLKTADDLNLESGSKIESKNLDEYPTILEILYSNGITGLSAASELSDHVAAGHETTGITMALLTYILSTPKYRHIQIKLQNELIENYGKQSLNDFKPPASYNEIDKLPYLQAVVQETLRLCSAIPGSEPRIVPKNSSRNDQFLWFDKKTGKNIVIPSGTIVSMQPHSLHRDPLVFPDPETFKPERWLLTPDSEKLKNITKHMMVFGAGIKMCLGMHLAKEEIKLGLATIYSRFSSELMDNYDYEKNMKACDMYTTKIYGEASWLKFKQLSP